jgi:hypothetical protein
MNHLILEFVGKGLGHTSAAAKEISFAPDILILENQKGTFLNRLTSIQFSSILGNGAFSGIDRQSKEVIVPLNQIEKFVVDEFKEGCATWKAATI